MLHLNQLSKSRYDLVIKNGQLVTYSFECFRKIVSGLFNAIGMCLDGHVTTRVVFPLYDNKRIKISVKITFPEMIFTRK